MMEVQESSEKLLGHWQILHIKLVCCWVCCYVERHRAGKEKKMLHEIAIYSHEEQKWVVWGFYEASRFQDLHAESCVWQWETSICIYIILILNHFGAVKHQQFWLTYCNPLCLSLCIPLSASAASSPFYSSSDSTRCHATLQGEKKQSWFKNSLPPQTIWFSLFS